MVGNTVSVEEKRLTTLERVEQLLQHIEQDTNGRLGRVRHNLNIAEENLQDDGEYNHCVRFALHQMSQIAKKYETIPPETTDRVHNLQGALQEEAALPPQEEITR